MGANQFLPVCCQTVPSPCHFQKLIALLALGQLLGEGAALLGIFPVL